MSTTTIRLKPETARALNNEAERLSVLDLGKKDRSKNYFLNNIIEDALLNIDNSRFISMKELVGEK